MVRNQFFGILGFLLYFCCYVCAKITINQIIGPNFVEDSSVDDLVLDCDFEAEGEENVVVKWFFNGMDVQIYQWIASAEHAYALTPWKDLIDTNYKVSNDPSTMLRALKFKEVSPVLSGNYTCKVSSDASDDFKTKQLVVYSPPTSFDLFLIGVDDTHKGNEVVFCGVANVLPKPSLELYVAGKNGSIMDLPDAFVPSRVEYPDDGGFYNISIMLPFNSNYLEDGTVRFVCKLSIPGTNHSESKSVENLVEIKIETQTSEGDYSDLNSTLSSNYTGETTIGENGKFHLRSSLLTVLFLLFSLVLAT